MSLANYQDKMLNEIVIPGSHDAGIYAANNSGNVKTQSLDILKQAQAGCRFFDLRIATHKRKGGGTTEYVHQAYHLQQSLVKGHKIAPWNRSNKGGHLKTHQGVAHAGGWGDSLTNMLEQAKVYVESNQTEFLILKFSKCYNWLDIAKTCVEVLGDAHYTDGGHLNYKQVKQLKGKVITVFDESAGDVLRLFSYQNPGIMFFRSLWDTDTKKSKDFKQNYTGLQYFGKFSSTGNVHKNTKKQNKVLCTGAHMDALGMMYWTTTGVFANIQKRNKKMWNQTNVAALQDTWKSGLEAAIEARIGANPQEAVKIALMGGTLGNYMKSFMPNIVMMDFIDKKKCDTVYELNDVAATSLAKLAAPEPKASLKPVSFPAVSYDDGPTLADLI